MMECYWWAINVDKKNSTILDIHKLAATNASVHYYPFIGGSTTTIERETGSFGSVGYEQGALGA